MQTISRSRVKSMTGARGRGRCGVALVTNAGVACVKWMGCH